jgi:hypothetical protein
MEMVMLYYISFFVLYYCTKNVIGGFIFEYSLSPTLSTLSTTTVAPHHHFSSLDIVDQITPANPSNHQIHQREGNDQDGQLLRL